MHRNNLSFHLFSSSHLYAFQLKRRNNYLLNFTSSRNDNYLPFFEYICERLTYCSIWCVLMTHSEVDTHSFFDFCFVCLLFSFSEFFRFECVHFIKCFSFLSAWIAFNRLLFVWHLACTPKCQHIVTYANWNYWKCLIYFICILLLWRHKFCGTCVCESEFLWTYIWVCVMCIVYISHTMYANCIRLFLLSRSRDHITL